MLKTSITQSVMDALVSKLAQLNFIAQPVSTVTAIAETQMDEKKCSDIMSSHSIGSIGSPPLVGEDALLSNSAPNMEIEEFDSPAPDNQPPSWSLDSELEPDSELEES